MQVEIMREQSLRNGTFGENIQKDTRGAGVGDIQWKPPDVEVFSEIMEDER